MSCTTVTSRATKLAVVSGVLTGGALLFPAAATAATDPSCYDVVGDCASATTTPTVAGTQATAADNTGKNRSGVVLGTEDSNDAGGGALGGTGTGMATELLGILGAGLVGAGTVSIVLNRRRGSHSF